MMVATQSRGCVMTVNKAESMMKTIDIFMDWKKMYYQLMIL